MERGGEIEAFRSLVVAWRYRSEEVKRRGRAVSSLSISARGRTAPPPLQQNEGVSGADWRTVRRLRLAAD